MPKHTRVDVHTLWQTKKKKKKRRVVCGVVLLERVPRGMHGSVASGRGRRLLGCLSCPRRRGGSGAACVLPGAPHCR